MRGPSPLLGWHAPENSTTYVVATVWKNGHNSPLRPTQFLRRQATTTENIASTRLPVPSLLFELIENSSKPVTRSNVPHFNTLVPNTCTVHIVNSSIWSWSSTSSWLASLFPVLPRRSCSLGDVMDMCQEVRHRSVWRKTETKGGT